MENLKSVFETLNAINVNEHVEKKGNLSYLSWAWAWATCKKHFPTAQYKIYERETDRGAVNYFTDGLTAWVKTGVEIEGLEHIEFLPVMDYKNKSIPTANITSFDVNKAIQRSLTKALARHGLGLYIYAGEDLPEEPEVNKEELLTALSKQQSEMNALDIDWREQCNSWILDKAKVPSQNLGDNSLKISDLKRLNKVYEVLIKSKKKTEKAV